MSTVAKLKATTEDVHRAIKSRAETIDRFIVDPSGPDDAICKLMEEIRILNQLVADTDRIQVLASDTHERERANRAEIKRRVEERWRARKGE